MKYGILKKHGAESVTKIITDQNTKLKELINNTDKFWAGWVECMPAGKVFITQRHHIPVFINKEYYLFKRIEINQYERKNIKGCGKIEKPSRELMMELLKEIGVKRLYDEDGCNGLFTKIEEGEFSIEDSAYCYINPFIPDGYWENHILETRYVEII